MSGYPNHPPRQQGNASYHPYQLGGPPSAPPYQPQIYQQTPYQQHPIGQPNPPYSYYHQSVYTPGPPYQPSAYPAPPYQYPTVQTFPSAQPPPSYYQSHDSYQGPSLDVKPSAVNLIQNPNFEPINWNPNGDTVEIKTEPWEIIETGGDGWRLEKIPQGSNAKRYPLEVGQNVHCVVGSNSWCKRSQIIHLDQRGFNSFIMDKQKPPIKICEWFTARSDCDSEYYVQATLFDQQKNPLGHFNSGIRSAGSSDWQKVEHVFQNYPSGVRFIKFEDGTKDEKFWAGHFGAKMCQPTITIELREQLSHNAGYYLAPSYNPPPQFNQSNNIVNLITNPSFSPNCWKGDTTWDIDFTPWSIEKNKDGYILEKTPQGAKQTYPPELSTFEVWCVATSTRSSQRCQVIDLVQKGFSADVLDFERPSIKIYEWFTSRSDCMGEYFLQVSLLSQNRMKIPGFTYDTALKKAPVGHWVKEEHVFTNVPPGVRFVEFRDGANDCKNWAGFYGAKMVGAFVGVISSFTPQAVDASPKPRQRNLLENGNLKPKNGWNGNNANEIEFSSWEILENGGDGIQLEKTPNGTNAGQYPVEGEAKHYCIATSHGWFKRKQIVDMVKNGFAPHLFKRLKIYICEWFASRTDNEGEYYFKVSLLDDSHKAIPGCTYDSGINRAFSDEWEKVDHTFFPVPETARYVLFEDGGKDTKIWAGNYGVKMFGAAVYAGEKQEKSGEECLIM